MDKMDEEVVLIQDNCTIELITCKVLRRMTIYTNNTPNLFSHSNSDMDPIQEALLYFMDNGLTAKMI